MARTGDPGDATALIDAFGRRIGRAMGWPPMAGRAACTLMLSDGPMTMAELRAALNASKGSVSEMTRLLMVSGTVRRFKEPGSRQFVYEWRDDAWAGCLKHQLDQNEELLALAATARERGAGLPEPQRGRIEDMHAYYTFMTRNITALLATYTADHTADRAAVRTAGHGRTGSVTDDG